jgi:hypothetical protein
MTAEFKQKIVLDADTSGAAEATKALNGLNQASVAVAAAMNGNVVGAFARGRAAFVALALAIRANPFGAIASTLVAVAAWVGKTAWGNYAEGIRKAREEADTFIERLRELKGLNLEPWERSATKVGKIESMAGDKSLAQLQEAGTEESLREALRLARSNAQTAERRGNREMQWAIEAPEGSNLRTKWEGQAARFLGDAEEWNRLAETIEKALDRVQKKKAELARDEADAFASTVAANLERQNAVLEAGAELNEARAQRLFAERRAESLGAKAKLPGQDAAKQLELLAEQERVIAELARLRGALGDLEAATRESYRKEADAVASAEKEYALSKLPPKEQRAELSRQIEAFDEFVQPLSPEQRQQKLELQKRRDALDKASAVSAGEGFDEFLHDTAGRLGGRRLSLEKGALRFRGKLGPSPFDNVHRFGSNEGKTAGEVHADLQKQSNVYLERIAKKVEAMGMKE